MNHVISIHFANSEEAKLKYLKEEDDEVYSHMSPLAKNGNFFLDRESYTDGQKLSKMITSHFQSLWLFHYSGHAEMHSLYIEDKDIRAEGIGHQLLQCPELVLVVLNGCATFGQVEKLLGSEDDDKGVKVVIATHAPVEDLKAKIFSVRFYDALSKQATIREAFEIAIGEIMQNNELSVFRGLDWKKHKHNTTKKGIWALGYHPKNERYLSERLPKPFTEEIEINHEPNKYLIHELWDVLKVRNEKLQVLDSLGDQLDLPTKRMFLINSLTAPLGEPLRKLLVPMGEEEKKGYDKISFERFSQIILTYRISIDLVSFTILSQVWEITKELKAFKISKSLKQEAKKFLSLSEDARRGYRYMPFLQSAKQFYIHVYTSMFGEEDKLPQERVDLIQATYYERIIIHIHDFLTDKEFYDACTYLEIYREKLAQSGVDKVERRELAILCERSEKFLSAIIQKLSLFAEHTLATVKAIQVRKYRSLGKPTFEHRVVKLINLLGKFEDVAMDLEESYMDSKSVLLMDNQNAIIGSSDQIEQSYLSFSPFVIDCNAFIENTDLAKIYFYHHYDQKKDRYYYYYVKNPKDKHLEVKPFEDSQKVDEKKGKVNKKVKKATYYEIWEQLTAFRGIFQS